MADLQITDLPEDPNQPDLRPGDKVVVNRNGLDFQAEVQRQSQGFWVLNFPADGATAGFGNHDGLYVSPGNYRLERFIMVYNTTNPATISGAADFGRLTIRAGINLEGVREVLDKTVDDITRPTAGNLVYPFINLTPAQLDQEPNPPNQLTPAVLPSNFRIMPGDVVQITIDAFQSNNPTLAHATLLFSEV